MQNKEKFIAFLDERIKKGFSIETTSCLESIKQKFVELFSNEALISMPERLILTDERRLDMLTGALEGGSNYWYEFLKASSLQVRKFGSSDEPFVDKLMKALQAGEKILVSEEGTGEDLGYLSMDSIKAGEMKMLNDENYSSHYFDIINENDDASTADIWFQFAVKGEIIYG